MAAKIQRLLMLETMEVLENGHAGIQTYPPGRGGISIPGEVDLQQYKQHREQTEGTVTL